MTHEAVPSRTGETAQERIFIRPARADDAPELARLAQELGYPTGAGEMHRRLGIIAGHADHAVFVAERDDRATEGKRAAAEASNRRILGWIHVARRLLLESGESAEILGLIVDRRARRLGIGRRLVEAAEPWSRARGLECIVVRSNVAREESHRFYPALDFALAKTQRVYVKPLSRSTGICEPVRKEYLDPHEGIA